MTMAAGGAELTRVESSVTRARSAPVVGARSAAGYPNNVPRGDVAARLESGERLNVQLIRRPDNPYDRNATEIHVPGPRLPIGHASIEPFGTTMRPAELLASSTSSAVSDERGARQHNPPSRPRPPLLRVVP